MKEDVQRASKTFDSIAEHFDKTRNRPWDEVVEFLEGLDGKLLDMGCGNGRHILEAVKGDLEVVGVDASKELLTICKQKVIDESYASSKVELIRADVKNLPLLESSFDSALFIAAIHHLKEGRIRSLREAKRVMKDDSKILISSWARELDRWDLEDHEREVMVPWHREDEEVIERFYHLYTLEELEEDVRRSGLSIIDSFHSKGNNYVKAKKLPKS